MTRPATDEGTLTFEATEIPASTSTVVNPFTDPVANLAASWDNEKGTSAGALSVTVPAASANRLAKKVSDAARAIDKSARVRFADKDGKPVPGKTLSKDSKGVLTMKFWLKNPGVKTETEA